MFYAGNELHAQEMFFRNTVTYSQKQGLSSPNIHKIVQDKYGFLWIATQDGLNRFDGNQFIKYNTGQKTNHRIFSSDVRDLIADNKTGLLWVICNQGGINVIDQATANSIDAYAYPQNRSEDTWRICAAVYNNKIFIGTSGGLELFDITARSFTSYLPADRNDSISRKAFSSDIRTISISGSGVMALGILDKGILFYDIPKQEGSLLSPFEVQQMKAGSFWPLCSQFINDTLFYCGTQKGLLPVNYAGKQIMSTGKQVAEKTGSIAAMSIGKKGKILLAGDRLAELDLAAGNASFIYPSFTEAESWLKNITSLFYDDMGNIWVGSRQGLCLIKKEEPVFRAVKNSPDIYNNKLGHIFAVSALSDSSVLLGTKDGLFLLDRNLALTQLYDKGLVQNIVKTGPGEYIISGYQGSRLLLNGKIGRLSSKYHELLPFESWQFNSFIKLNDSIGLLGTESNSGVLEWNVHNSTVSRLDTKASGEKRLPSDIVNSIFLNSEGEAIILSDYFISVYEPGKKIKQVLDNTVKQATGIYMQMQQTDGHYWIAAYGTGLIKTDLNFSVQKIFRTADGLSNAGLYSIFNYKDSILFLTSNYGISVFDIQKEKFYNYYEEDGLQNNTFEEACRDTLGGTFFAGGAGGFVRIFPQRLSRDQQAPVFYFTGVQAEGSSRSFLDTTDLNAPGYSIAAQAVQVKISFSGLHFANAQRVTYAYRIRELGNYWIDLSTQSYITLIGFSPGKYHLQVKAANEDGIWSEPKELVLVFLPKWYQTWWFRLLVFLIAVAIIYAFYRYRIAQVKKQHEIRKNIATDLHDDLGSTLNSVKVFTNLAISGVNHDESLQQIKSNLNEATLGLRDMIWVLDDSLDTVDELVTRLKQFSTPVAAASHIDVQVHASPDVNRIKLKKEEKRNLFLICKEAINNSIKYSGASVITLEIIPSGKKIQITITDNGKGFDEATVKKGYGLKNMQYRAGQIQYKALLHSAPGSGTRISITPQ